MLVTAKRFFRTVTPAPIYRWYRQARVKHLVSSYKTRIVEHEFAGFPLRLSIEDPLAEGWYDHDWDEPPEVAALRRYGLAPGATVFDLGAHQAVVALILSRITGDRGRVIAVEAETHNAAVAERNVLLNGVRNMTIVRAAVTDRSGDALFMESLNGRLTPGSKAGKIRVPAITVDRLAKRYGHPDVVLIDVEGAEVKALAGAGRTLAQGAIFVVEVHIGCGLEDLGATTDDVLAAFAGYDVRTVDPETGAWSNVGDMKSRVFLVARPAVRAPEDS